MVLGKSLRLGLIGGLALCLRASASPEVLNPAQLVEADSVSEPIDSLPNGQLSSLLLPLPPLFLPDLLLPPYQFASFNSQRLDQQLALYSAYLQRFGTPDVLIVGSSRSLQGIDPLMLQEALGDRGYENLRIYNFGINGATAQVIDLLLREILLPEQLPRLIIWGDGLRAFNSGRPDITYNGIISSAGYQQMQSGKHPIPQRGEPVLEPLVNPQTLRVAEAAPAASIAPDLTTNGFNPVAPQFDPYFYYQQYPRVPGNFDSTYVPFSLYGVQTEATRRAAQFARSQGISLVFVNLPLTQDYLDPIRQDYEQQFDRHMQQVADQEGFIFRNLSQQPQLMQNQYFVDPSHINREGARAVADYLATDDAIPWSILHSEQTAAR